MKEITYSKEELDYIKDTLGLIIRDVKDIYDASEQENILILTTLDKEKYYLAIKKDKIALLVLRTGDEEWENLWREDNVNLDYKGNGLLAEIYQPEKTIFSKNQQPKIVLNNLSDDKKTMTAIQFIVEYDHIREELIEYVQKTQHSKEEIMKKIREVRCKYGNEIIVDLGQNTSMNMQTITMQEENGKKVGTIDFGSRIVKIITEGDIVLTRVDEAKEKIKTK